MVCQWCVTLPYPPRTHLYKSKCQPSANCHDTTLPQSTPLTHPSHTPHTPLTHPSHTLHTPLTHPYHTPHTPLTHPSHTPHTHLDHTSITPRSHLDHTPHTPLTHPSHTPNTPLTLGSDRIFGSAIRLLSAGSVRFGFGSDYPNINRTSHARMSISNAPRVTKKSRLTIIVF